MENQPTQQQPSPTNLPAIKTPGNNDLISQWIGGPEQSGSFLRTTFDMSSLSNVALATRLLTESEIDNATIDGQTFNITGLAIGSASKTDDKTGEIKTWPRTMVALDDGRHLVFNGIVAFRSALFLIATLKPEQWASGIKIKVHSIKSQYKTLMHRFEVIV